MEKQPNFKLRRKSPNGGYKYSVVSSQTARFLSETSVYNKLQVFFIPCCHLLVTVNLCWTRQLSFLITDELTRLSTPWCSGKRARLTSSVPVSVWQQVEESLEPLPGLCWRDCPQGLRRVPSRMSGHGVARLIVMGCGRATEAPGQAVNNYSDVRAAALAAVTHTQEMEICQIMFHDLRCLQWIMDWVMSVWRWKWHKRWGCANIVSNPC